MFNQLLEYNMKKFSFKIRYWYYRSRVFLDTLLVFLSQSLIYGTVIVHIESPMLSIILSSIPFALVYLIWRWSFVDRNEYNSTGYSLFFVTMIVIGLVCNLLISHSIELDTSHVLKFKAFISSIVLGILLFLINTPDKLLKFE